MKWLNIYCLGYRVLNIGSNIYVQAISMELPENTVNLEKDKTLENAENIKEEKVIKDPKLAETKGNTKIIEEPMISTLERDLATKHKRSFGFMYDILDKEMHELGRMQASKNDSKEWKEEWDKTFGAKETITSVAIRLVNAFNKVAPMETKALAAIKAAEIAEAKEYASIKLDREIYDKFIKKVREGYDPTCVADCYREEGAPLFEILEDDDPVLATPFLDDGDDKGVVNGEGNKANKDEKKEEGMSFIW